MNKNHLTLLFCYFILSSIFAQKNTTIDTLKSLDEVIVSANKFSQTARETGKNVTIIGQAELSKKNGQNVAQILQNQAGIGIAGSNNIAGTQPSVFIRGAKSDYTLVLLNGMPISDASTISSSSIDINLFPSLFFKKIEIVKNSQSTLYGSDAVAGVINLTTKDGDGKKLSLGINQQFGSYSTWNTAVGISSEINNFQGSILANYGKTKGFSDAFDQQNTGNFDKDGSQNLSLLATAAYKLGASKFRFNGILGRTSGSIDDGALKDEKDFTISNQFSSLGLGYDLKLGKTIFTINLKADESNRSYTNDSTFVNPGAWSKYSQSSYKGNIYFGEVFTKVNINKNINFLVGADHKDISSNQSENYDGFVSKLNSRDSINTSLSSIYGSLLLQNIGGFYSEIGGRLNRHSVFGNNTTFSFSPTYNFNKIIRVFGSASTGFKAPSIYQTSSIYGNKNLKPEKSFTTEVGLALGNAAKSSTKISFFSRKIKDIIYFKSSPNPPSYGQYANFDQQNDNGFELDGKMVLEKLTFNANYTYTTGKTTKLLDNGTTTTTKILYRRPKNLFNIGVSQQLTDEFSWTLNYRFTDKRYDTFYNETTFASEDVLLKEYQLLDFYAQYTLIEKYRFYLNLNNVLNSKYQDIYGFNTKGINFTFGVNANF